jgi:hypothetical protein
LSLNLKFINSPTPNSYYKALQDTSLMSPLWNPSLSFKVHIAGQVLPYLPPIITWTTTAASPQASTPLVRRAMETNQCIEGLCSNPIHTHKAPQTCSTKNCHLYHEYNEHPVSKRMKTKRVLKTQLM